MSRLSSDRTPKAWISMQSVEKVRELLLNDQIFSADSRPSTMAISSHYALAYARFNYKSLTLLLLFQITSVMWRERSHAQTRWGSGVNQSREQRRLGRMRKRQIEDESCKGNKQQLGQMKMRKTDAKGHNAKVAASSLIRISNRTNLR